ncbi:MAG: dihydrofolate reductase [Bacteroidia bacterium]|nr:dihydrofolate reductase [Bacteroidia bacterium]
MNPILEQFADIRVLRYEVPGFENLSLNEKLLVYHLSMAADAGRDILWDQNYKFNLMVRDVVEKILRGMQRDNCVDDNLLTFAKRIWVANGIHHHYSNDKFRPDFTESQFNSWYDKYVIAPVTDYMEDEDMKRIFADSQESLRALYLDIFFNPNFDAKKVSLADGVDLIYASAVNFYGDRVSQQEVENFYADPKGKHPLNSSVVKYGTDIIEEVWRQNGLYDAPIRNVIKHLEAAKQYALTEAQGKTIDLLISYYKDGNPDTFDEMNKVWVADKDLKVDFINGFIEVYSDPLGLKATWESVVELRDEVKTQRVATVAENAQWFEDHSPVALEYKKKCVKGVSMNIVNVAMLGGDCYPTTPIGINLPNADWIREQYGSKSVALANIEDAYHEASQSSGVLDEFAFSAEECERARLYGAEADNLHTQLHECLGHGSGQMREGITLDALKAYGSTIEETRADLYALYFMADPKIVELGLLPNLDAAFSHYDSYMRSGLLVQLSRLDLGTNIEESHMRNRHLIAAWALEHCDGAAEMVVRDGKHYVHITDYNKMREVFGILLKEIQRIKSEGDFEAARNIVETYGVKVDIDLHREIKSRYDALGVAPFSCFVNPVYSLVKNDAGEVVDVTISYETDFTSQMLSHTSPKSV